MILTTDSRANILDSILGNSTRVDFLNGFCLIFDRRTISPPCQTYIGDIIFCYIDTLPEYYRRSIDIIECVSRNIQDSS